MNNDQRYPTVELIEWDKYPDYIRVDTTKEDDWYIYQFAYFRKYLKKVVNGWSILDFFGDALPAEKVAIYATTVFTDVVVDDLRRHTDKKIYVSDKKIDNETNDSNMIKISPDVLYEKYKNKEILKIIVCGMFQENRILDDLLEIGFELNDVITLSNLLLNV